MGLTLVAEIINKIKINQGDDLLKKKIIDAYNKLKKSEYIDFNNNLTNNLPQQMRGNKSDKIKNLNDLKLNINFELNMHNKRLEHHNGIIGFLIGTLSGAIIDKAILKKFYEVLNDNDNIKILVIILIGVAAMIAYDVILHKSSKKTRYYENLLSIIDNVINKLSS